MTRRRHTPEQIIRKLAEGQNLLAGGMDVEEVCRQFAIAPSTWARWLNQYGSLKADDARRLKELEGENARLKRLLAEAELDKAIGAWRIDYNDHNDHRPRSAHDGLTPTEFARQRTNHQSQPAFAAGPLIDGALSDGAHRKSQPEPWSWRDLLSARSNRSGHPRIPHQRLPDGHAQVVGPAIQVPGR